MNLRLLVQLTFLFQCAWVVALLSNRTIDDTYGDSVTGTMPNYTDFWDDASCPPSHCNIRPPPASAYKQSYHAATYVVGGGVRAVTLEFRGTAIYVFFTLANSVPDAWTETFCAFALDDQLPEQYHHKPTTSPDYQYQALVYHKTDLANVNHSLSISANDYPNMSFINFDYAIYTFDDEVTDTSAQSSPTSKPGGIETFVTDTVPVSVTTTDTTFNTFKSPTPSSLWIITSSSSSLSHSISTVGSTSRRSGAVETTSLPSVASSLSSNDNTTASPKQSGDINDRKTVSKASIGAIAGGVVGGFALFIVIIIFLLRCRRRRKLLETAHKLAQQQLDCTPFTPVSPAQADMETRRSQEAMPFFMPIRKQREVVTMPEPHNNRSSVACATAGSDMTEISFQEMDGEKESDLGTGFAVPENVPSNLRHVYQAMRAEIQRLRAQLDATRSSGFTDELPRYSRT